MARNRIEVPLDKLKWAAEQQNSATAAANALGLSYATFKRRCLEAGIKFKTNQPGKGEKRPAPWLEVPLDKVLNNEHFMVGRGLKRKLLKAGLVEDKCDECSLPPLWNGKPLTLQLDHVDGDRSNNTRANLRLLCPNCHSQTPTFSRGKWKKNAAVAELVDAQR